MSAIKEMLTELRYEVFKVVFIKAFLDASIFFLILYLFLTIFSIGVLIPLLAALVYLIIISYREMKKYTLKNIEDKNPEIKEMLRTAADNKDEDSFMAKALFDEVIYKMKNISSGTFVDLKLLMKKLAVIFVISGLLFTMAFFNINISKFENPFANVNLDFNFNKDKVQEVNDFNDVALVTLGSGKVDISLDRNLNQIDFNDVSNPEDTGSLTDEFGNTVDAKASQAYTNSLDDINDRKTAAEYSQKIK